MIEYILALNDWEITMVLIGLLLFSAIIVSGILEVFQYFYFKKYEK